MIFFSKGSNIPSSGNNGCDKFLSVIFYEDYSADQKTHEHLSGLTLICGF